MASDGLDDYRIQWRLLSTNAWTHVTIDSATLPGQLAALSVAIEGMSDAGMWRETQETQLSEDPEPVEGSSNIDAVRLLFRSNAGTTVAFVLPSPDASIFEVDNETVDENDAAVASYITEMLATAKGPAGEDLDEYIRGFRVTLPE